MPEDMARNRSVTFAWRLVQTFFSTLYNLFCLCVANLFAVTFQTILRVALYY